MCQLRWPHWLAVLALWYCAPVVSAGPRYSSRIVATRGGGDIRGIILELNSRHLEPVEVFRGIPYAAPPVGDLRFRPPARVPTWTGTKLADTFGAVCPQRYPDVSNRTAALMHMPKGRFHFLKKLVPYLLNQSEDCLFLNLYIPGSGNRGLEAPYAVMFYVHGESFEWGSGNPYDGSVLASYGHVIVVTINYRLGILGFLKTTAKSTPSDGNLGLRDIAAALRWVVDNIAAFGGDPSRITLVGHDTGAALVNLLLLSSLVKGLFSRVVLLSGSALSPWATMHQPDTIRRSVGEQLGCLHQLPKPANGTSAKDIDIDDIGPCLRERPLEAILDVRLPNVRFMPRWAPYIDDGSTAPEPNYSMEHASEAFITTEIMLGVATMESYNDFSATDIQYGFEEDERNRVLRTYIRNAFVYHLNEIFSAVKNEYTDWDKPIQHPINVRDSTMEALSDGHTVAPLVRVAYLHARRGAKTYLFHFGYQTKESDYPQRLGSVRGESLTYAFGLPLVGGRPHFAQNFSRQDSTVAEAVLGLLTRFAKRGDPNEQAAGQHTHADPSADYGTVRERSRYRIPQWDEYETGGQQYLSLTLKPRMKSHYRGHKMAVWLNLIPQLHQPGDDDVSMRHHHFHEREQHYYAGAVRPESFTRPPPLYTSSGSRRVPPAIDCEAEDIADSLSIDIDSSLIIDDDQEPNSINDRNDINDDDTRLLEQLANKHYYSYTAALGVTVGVGCLLLVLNMLIFAGIYSQRDRYRRKKTSGRSESNGGTSSSISSGESIPMTQNTPSSPQHSPSTVIKVHEPPPCYATVNKSHHDKHKQSCERPKPPMRTSSNPQQQSDINSVVKKRAQTQEISV